MGFIKKLFGGDAGIAEAMYETYSELKMIHPSLEEYEILALVLRYRFKKIPSEVGLMIAVLFPRIEILIQWVIVLENSGGPKHLNEYLDYTTTLDDREKALKYIKQKAHSKMFPAKNNSILKDIKVSEEIVDISAESLWGKFENELTYTYHDDSKPLDYLSHELRNTIANIYYRYFIFCEENQSECKSIDFNKIKNNVISQIDIWPAVSEFMSQKLAIITLHGICVGMG